MKIKLNVFHDPILNVSFSSGSLGLNATVNHSAGSGVAAEQMAISDQIEEQRGSRGRLNSTSQGENVPEFQPSDGCDRSNCTDECYR